MTARVVDQFPCQVREVEHAWIPLADGTRLAVRYWLPEDAEQSPVPAILEYIPYRKRDGTAARDEAMHPYFAGHGYAAVRVDMRGGGESEGLLLGEYLQQEQDDAVEVIDWISKQPWCTGQVGMMGKSWGGFNSLQVAARRPPALKCIITVYSTDDRYADDIHYMGGCLLYENPNWAFTMFGQTARPPDPRLVGEGWRQMWQARLESTQPWIIEWLSHQRRDAFWKHGSVCEDFVAIQCPVYAIGGWADPYTNPVPRLLAGLTVPRKGLVGPWGHQYPHQAFPKPDAGFLQEALRWWDHWLKGVDNGIMEEPRYRVWMQDSVPPAALHETRPGRWVAEPGWPSAHVETRRLTLNAEGLSERARDEVALDVAAPETVGLCTPIWGNAGDGASEEPVDQRPDDALSLAFDSAPLEEPLEILGAPAVELELAADQSNAFVAARLSEVLPDGASALVSYGLFNLTRRESFDETTPVVPGQRMRVRVQMNDVAHVFPAGSRLRVALSNAFWPIAWPSPKPVRLTVFAGASALTLPVRPPRPEDRALAALPEAESSPVHPFTPLRVAEPTVMQMIHDLAGKMVTFHHVEDSGEKRIDRDGWEFGGKVTRNYVVEADDPTSARVELRGRETFGRAGGPQIRIETRQDMTCDETDFVVHARIDAFENGRPVFARTWLERIPRDGV